MKKIYLTLFVASTLTALGHAVQAQVNMPCFASFSVNSVSSSTDTICVGLPISFIDQSSSPGGPMSLFVWDFGDGTSPVFDQNVVHTFTNPGSFTVTLNASDGAGCNQMHQKIIKIIGKPAVVAYNRTLPTCAGDCDGTITVNFNAPLPQNQYTVNWSGTAQTGLTATDLCGNLNYEAVVTDQYGCVDDETLGEYLPDPNPIIPLIYYTNGYEGCPGDLIELEGQAYGGTPPYSLMWSGPNGTADFTSTNAIFTSYNLTASNAGTITLDVTDSNGCQGSTIAYIGYSPTSIDGTVTVTGGQPCINCAVELYVWDQYGFWMDYADGISTDANGQYSLTVAPLSDVIVRIVPNGDLYPNACPTYSGNVHSFELATQINSGCGNAITHDITVIGWPNNAGLCTLTGIVYRSLPGKVAEEDPIPLIDVVVEKVPPGGSFIMGHDITDANGNYSFSFMPETNGSEYLIYVDVPGVPQVNTYNVTVGSGDVLIGGLDFCIQDNIGGFPVATDTCNTLITRVNELKNGLEMTLSPNPGNGLVRVQFHGLNPSKPTTITVTDAYGRQVAVFIKRLGSVEQIDLTHLPNGAYAIKADQNGRSATGKLLINH